MIFASPVSNSETLIIIITVAVSKEVRDSGVNGGSRRVCISAKAVHSLEEVNKELYHITSDATKDCLLTWILRGKM